MGLFTKKTSRPGSAPSTTSPLVKYHITQILSSTLTATPATSSSPSSSETYTPLTITLSRPPTRRDSIEISVQRAENNNNGATVGHCLVQVSTGKFLACKLSRDGEDGSDGGVGGDGHWDVSLLHSGHGEGAVYTIDVSGVKTTDGKGGGGGEKKEEKRVLRWVHDSGSLHGGMVNAERRFRLESVGGKGKEEEDKKSVLARFAGASGGVSEFGMLEVYGGGLSSGEGDGGDDWCGLLVLTAVCVYAREERHREKRGKVKSKFEVVSGFGELIGLVGGI